MFVALDKNGNRIYADHKEKYLECYCQGCQQRLIHKMGSYNRPYFSHTNGSQCAISELLDKDYKSPWHIRMQEYFPEENREVRFIDAENNEVHIADVYIEEANTVIEFQHSSISDEEFLSRTNFHLNNGRRIAWVFDESQGKEELGRFRKEDYFRDYEGILYPIYRWMRMPRKAIRQFANFADDRYKVFVYTGKEGDTVRRIEYEDFGYEKVCFSVHEIQLTTGMDCNEFFIKEDFWTDFEPYKTQKEKYRRKKEIEKQNDAVRLVNLVNSLAYRRQW